MSEAAWVAKDARRIELVDKLFDVGLSEAELAELDALQLEAGLRTRGPWGSPAGLEATAKPPAA